MPTRYDAMMRGYQDAQDRTPWKRARQSFAEETRHGATPEQDAYWRGWRGGRARPCRPRGERWRGALHVRVS